MQIVYEVKPGAKIVFSERRESGNILLRNKPMSQ